MKRLPSGRTVGQVNADCNSILNDYLAQERNVRWAQKYGLERGVSYLRDYLRERLSRVLP